MEFSEFAGRLHAIIGAGSSTAVFTKSIIEAILADVDQTLSDDGKPITDEYSSETYKAYFNGTTKITRLAKKVLAYVEPFNFSNYIDEFSDASRDTLVKAFADVLPDANAHNIGEHLANLFVEILSEASFTKRKATKKPEATSPLSPDQQVIFENLREPLMMFAKAVDAQTHHVAENIRRNKKSGPSEDEPEVITAEVVDDKQPSGAADPESEPTSAEGIPDAAMKVQIITSPTIVNQNGEKNIHIEHLDVLNL